MALYKGKTESGQGGKVGALEHEPLRRDGGDQGGDEATAARGGQKERGRAGGGEDGVNGRHEEYGGEG